MSMKELSVDEILAERERLRTDFLDSQREKAFLEKDWESFFLSIPRSDYLDAFLDIQNDISNDEFFEVFILVYKSIEFNFGDIEESLLLKVKNLNQTKYDSIKKLTIYRGIGSDSMEYGYSWTTDIEVAKKFATHRSLEDGVLLKCEIDGDAIVCMDVNGGEQNESEVLILPSMLNINKVKRYLVYMEDQT